MNALRKHLDRVKGGRLAQGTSYPEPLSPLRLTSLLLASAAAPSTVVSLILSVRASADSFGVFSTTFAVHVASHRTLLATRST